MFYFNPDGTYLTIKTFAMVRVVFKVNIGSVLMKRDYIFVQCI